MPYQREDPLQVTYGDRTYNGSWRMENGRVFVNSAYGSANRDVLTGHPKVIAELLLKELAAKWKPGGS